MYDTQKIQTLMTMNGMTQRALAKEADLHTGTVSRLMLTGRASYLTIKKVAHALNVNTVELIRGEE